MKLLKQFLGAVLLAALSNAAIAELKLVERKEVSYGDAPVILVSDDGRQYLVTKNRPKTGPPFLQIEDFFDSRFPRRVVINESPLFLPAGRQRGLFAMTKGYENLEWIAVKLNKALTKVEKFGDLKSILLVTETIKAGDKYIIGGASKDPVPMPILVKMNSKLKIERELIVRSKKGGQVGNVFVQGDAIFAVTVFEDKYSELWRLSSDLSIQHKIKLAGGAATGIPLSRGGFAVTYTSPVDRGVFIERFDANAQSLWKKKIFTSSGITSGLDILCELQDGLGLVGGNNNRLLVARISEDGQRVRITEDTRSGLSVADDAFGYLVGVRDNKIHIRGRTRTPDGKITPGGKNYTSFHFVETPAP